MSGASQQIQTTGDLALPERCLAAGFAAVVSSILVNPLEVAKTRMQAEVGTQLLGNINRAISLPQVPLAPRLAVDGWWMDMTYSQPRLSHPALTSRSAMGLMARMAEKEGLKSLWRGLDAAMLLNLPLIAIYLPCYDYIEGTLGRSYLGMYGPLVSGVIARACAVTATSPLELLKTRVQGSRHLPGAASGQLSLAAAGLWREAAAAPAPFGPARTLWRGLSVSLAKDLPFAGLYWALLEPTRSALLRKYGGQGAEATRVQLATTNAVAGGLAASLAAAISTPFDVVKTKLQTARSMHQAGPSWSKMLGQLYQAGGLSALFTGAGLRSARTGTAYGIMMASYELAKSDMRRSFHAGHADDALWHKADEALL